MKRFLVLLTNSHDVGYTVLGSFDTLQEVAPALPGSFGDYADILDLQERVWWDVHWEPVDGRYALALTQRKE